MFHLEQIREWEHKLKSVNKKLSFWVLKLRNIPFKFFSLNLVFYFYANALCNPKNNAATVVNTQNHSIYYRDILKFMKPKKNEVLRASSVKRSAMFIHRNQYTAFQYTRVVRKVSGRSDLRKNDCVLCRMTYVLLNYSQLKISMPKIIWFW